MTSNQIHFRYLNKVKRKALATHLEYLDKTFKELVTLGQTNATKIETKKERVSLSESASHFFVCLFYFFSHFVVALFQENTAS